jgi:hypothetical protein
VISGPALNRIDILVMGDGYTVSERQKYIQDVKRLVSDMFTDETFRPVLPLLNIRAVFRASLESGIGTGGNPKKTAFGLFRKGTELRGIEVYNSLDARAVCKNAGESKCDYPMIIGNDAFYGGLGGEFVIGTRYIEL